MERCASSPILLGGDGGSHCRCCGRASLLHDVYRKPKARAVIHSSHDRQRTQISRSAICEKNLHSGSSRHGRMHPAGVAAKPFLVRLSCALLGRSFELRQQAAALWIGVNHMACESLATGSLFCGFLRCTVLKAMAVSRPIDISGIARRTRDSGLQKRHCWQHRIGLPMYAS